MKPSEFEAKWAAEADKMRQRGVMVSGPALVDELLADYHAVVAGEQDALLDLETAAQVSGYSPDHLSRLVRAGTVPDRRPAGSRGRIAIRRGDLPMKPGRRHTEDAGVHDLASRLYGGKEGRHGYP